MRSKGTLSETRVLFEIVDTIRTLQNMWYDEWFQFNAIEMSPLRHCVETRNGSKLSDLFQQITDIAASAWPQWIAHYSELQTAHKITRINGRQYTGPEANCNSCIMQYARNIWEVTFAIN